MKMTIYRTWKTGLNGLRASITIALTASSVLLPSCSIPFLKAGPDYERPETVEVPISYENDTADTTATYDGAAWWKTFGDPELNGLVEEVISGNLDIRKATAVIREFGSYVTQSRADRLPSINLNGSYQHQYMPATQPMPGMSSERESESYNASAAAAFEIDLWGKLSRAEEAARATLLASRENRRTIMHSIISETVSLYIQLSTCEKRIILSEENIKAAGKSLRIVRARYERGIASILELKQAERTMAQAETTLPQLRQDLGTARQRLSVLLGRYPSSKPHTATMDDYKLDLSPVPPGLPSNLLERRPDILAAEARLHSAAARVGVAKSNLFPRIALTGSYGYTSDELSDLFTPDNLLWNLVAGVTQPLFNSGKLIAAKNVAWAQYEQSAIDYAKTVLQAFAEVEGVLLTRDRQIEKREKILIFVDKAREVERIASARYERGISGYLSVLDAMQARYQAEENLLLVDLLILTNRVTLHRALAGRWPGVDDVDRD
ncbi:MAG: efflux transporter outer membrane subunit [Candidatus Krumholzibacteria bacterium]|nr:efflux transporter outer membrane subunit [Candidatus Krumholzibacteria bacterium]